MASIWQVRWLALRIGVTILAFILSLAVTLLAAAYIINFTYSLFPPDIGNPSTDPHGRGYPPAVAIVPLGGFVSVLLAFVSAWLGWHLSDRRNWSFDSLISAPLFLLFSAICTANYIHLDEVITRDTQAILNLPLAISGAVIVFILQRSLVSASSMLLRLSGSVLLAFCIYGFVAIPLWYSLSYLSWKQGAGELDSLESAAKAVSAAASILAVVGLQWKNGIVSIGTQRETARASAPDHSI